LSFGQNCNKISKFKNDVLCNVLNEIGQIKCTLFFYHKWGGFMVKELISIFGVHKSIPKNDMGYGPNWNVD
jgi:hypothetical protein